MRIDFYHLSAQPLERVLPMIAERVLAQRERLLIVADDEKLLGRLNHDLWSYRPDSFLPHGLEPGQPVRLARIIDSDETAINLAIADGIWREDAMRFARTFFLFDQQMIESARHAWRMLASETDAERHYWKQDDRGRWFEGP